jgi:hypothetical protein
MSSFPIILEVNKWVLAFTIRFGKIGIWVEDMACMTKNPFRPTGKITNGETSDTYRTLKWLS